MLCPRCGTQREALQGPCSHCGFAGTQAPAPETPLSSGPSQPGKRLHHGRYHLQEKGAQRTWFAGISETNWLGWDVHQQGEIVLLYEIALPASHALAIQAMLRVITPALVSAGKHSMFPTLKDVFEESDRMFFVFASIQAETLHARLSRLGRPLSEQEALEMCRELSAALEILALQSPPLVHGCLCPEHMYCASTPSRFLLGPLSPLTAHGDLRFLKGRVDGWNSPYSAPEFRHGIVDTRSDLYALMSTTYYAVTGVIPRVSGGDIPPARYFNAELSGEFTALLTKGLHPIPHQRYQRPSELHRDVLAIISRTSSRNIMPSIGTSAPAPSRLPGPQTTRLGNGAPVDSPHPFPIKLDLPEPVTLLPSAEVLPPMREGNDYVEALLLLIVVVLSLSGITVLGSFHF